MLLTPPANALHLVMDGPMYGIEWPNKEHFQVLLALCHVVVVASTAAALVEEVFLYISNKVIKADSGPNTGSSSE